MAVHHRMNVTVNLNSGEIYGAVNDSEVQTNVDSLANAALTMQLALAPVDTGRLVSTLGIRKTADGTGREIGSINHNLDYPAIVETGHTTEAGTWVPPQPYIRPSMDAVRRRLSDGE